jgi:predicted PolB exonuclease-like 3'-5' exonuclease
MRILNKYSKEDIIFIDIETVPLVESLEIDSPLFEAWSYKKRNDNLSNTELQESYSKEAGLYAEFGKIICISVGKVISGNKIKVVSFSGDNEEEILTQFCETLESKKNTVELCGHNIKKFDIPFIVKRCIINRVNVPPKLDVSGLKPWEITYLDTMELWGGYSSLISICVALGIESPKDGIDGSKVAEEYYKGNLSKIVKYCEADTKAVALVLLTFMKEDTRPLLFKLFEGYRYTEEEKKELEELIKDFSSAEKKKLKVVLDAMTSTARGKITKVTKKDIKELLA